MHSLPRSWPSKTLNSKSFTPHQIASERAAQARLGREYKLTDEVAMEYYRLQKIKDGTIELITGEEGELDGLSEAGIKRAKKEKVTLSEIIEVLNDCFGTEFEEAER